MIGAATGSGLDYLAQQLFNGSSRGPAIGKVFGNNTFGNNPFNGGVPTTVTLSSPTNIPPVGSRRCALGFTGTPPNCVPVANNTNTLATTIATINPITTNPSTTNPTTINPTTIPGATTLPGTGTNVATTTTTNSGIDTRLDAGSKQRAEPLQ